MKSLKLLFIQLIVLLLLNFSAGAQTKAIEKKLTKQQTWQLLDYEQDTVFGTSVNRAYKELLKGKKSHQVIVAVIDTGLDTAQEDLKGHIWTNTKEIPGNGIDDDHNGYVDDAHGWNFLGGKDGQTYTKDSYESYREYYRLRLLYSGITDSNEVKISSRQEYAYWLKIKNNNTIDSLQYKNDIDRSTKILKRISFDDSVLRTITKKDTLYIADIKNSTTPDTIAIIAKEDALGLVKKYNIADDISIERWIEQGNIYENSVKANLDDLSIDPNAERLDIVGDDPYNINDKNYGNSNITSGDNTHGTCVSGIIAAIRGNNIGMDGIGDNVLLMTLRTDCDGDERDKDIALAIRYAVNNGAKVINMSFGKHYSPGKQWVDDAISYAKSKDVLLVHIAGNEEEDIDSINYFPTPYLNNSKKKADNYITVGASTSLPDSLLVASFSSYGTKVVDLFAPGLNIYSTLPGNKYVSESGTSCAAPVVAGIAALILEYYPSLHAAQVKDIIMKSVTSLKGKMVYKPGTNEKVDFATLCVSGGVVNAYKALQLAAKVASNKN